MKSTPPPPAGQTPDPTATAALLADRLERTWAGSMWYGPSLKEALDGVTPAEAVSRPIPDAHTILELLQHMTVQARSGLEYATGQWKRGPTPEEDWPASEGPLDEKAWRAHLTTLELTYRHLAATTRALGSAQLSATPPRRPPHRRRPDPRSRRARHLSLRPDRPHAPRPSRPIAPLSASGRPAELLATSGCLTPSNEKSRPRHGPGAGNGLPCDLAHQGIDRHGAPASSPRERGAAFRQECCSRGRLRQTSHLPHLPPLVRHPPPRARTRHPHRPASLADHARLLWQGVFYEASRHALSERNVTRRPTTAANALSMCVSP